MKINGELKAQEIQHKISEQNYEKDNDTSIFNFSEPENSNGIDYDELIKTSNQSNLQIEDLDFDANYSFEDFNFDDSATISGEGKKSEAQIAADKFTKELFGDINIPSKVDDYTGISSISKSELNTKLNSNYDKAYASQATIDFAKHMHGTDTVKYVDEKGAEHEIKSKEDLKKFKQNVPENPQDIPVGSIVTMDNPKDGNFHSGILIGYTDDGKALVMEANSDKADGGAAIVAYDFNSSSTKSIKGYIPVEGLKDEKPIAENDNTDIQKQEESINIANESENNPLTKEEELAQSFTSKLFGDEINLKDFSADEVTNDKNGHYIKAGSKTKAEFEANIGINYGSKYASQATIDMAKSMYGIGANDKLTDTDGHTINSKEDIKKYGKDIPQTADGQHPVPIGSMVITDNPNGGNSHSGIVVGYTNDGRAIVAEANSAKSTDGQGAALAVYSFNSNDEKSIKKYIPINSDSKGAEEIQNTKNEEQVAIEEPKISIAVSEVDKTNSEMTVENISPVSSTDDTNKLYESLGLKKQGLNYDVFATAIEGYRNLDDKGNGRLTIFDATGDKKCYIIDMKNQKFLYSTEVILGEKGMGSSIQSANKEGSHATLSGYMKVGTTYSPSKSKFWREGIRLIGLENDINNNALSKGVVIHYVKPGQKTTWGCMGIPPVMTDGRADHAASKKRNREYFPEGTIVFTYPGKNRIEEYKNLSSLYA